MEKGASKTHPVSPPAASCQHPVLRQPTGCKCMAYGVPGVIFSFSQYFQPPGGYSHWLQCTYISEWNRNALNDISPIIILIDDRMHRPDTTSMSMCTQIFLDLFSFARQKSVRRTFFIFIGLVCRVRQTSRIDGRLFFSLCEPAKHSCHTHKL